MGPKARQDALRHPRPEPAFEQFVAAQSTRLFRTAYLLTGDRGAAEDLLQVTLLRTANRWGFTRQAPEAYARRVLVNLVRDRHRTATRRVVEVALEDVYFVTGRVTAVIAKDATGQRITIKAPG